MKPIAGVVLTLLVVAAAPASAHHFCTNNENIYRLRKLYEMEEAKTPAR